MGPRFAPIALPAEPGRPSAGLVSFARRVLRPLVRLFHRATVEGWDQLPTGGPFVLVANHSAGMGIAEILAFLTLYLERHGRDRPLAGFAHPLGLRLFPASFILRHAGAVPSTYEAARATLAQGVPLLIFPGGEYETLRPIWQASRVDFGGRKGFLKLAREAGVPIVPMGITGSHATAPVLWRSRHLLPTLLVTPRLVGLKRWGLTGLGVLGALAIGLGTSLTWPWQALAIWAWLGSPFIYVPWVPSTIRFRIGPPLAPETLFPAGDDDLAQALATVEGAVQALVTPR